MPLSSSSLVLAGGEVGEAVVAGQLAHAHGGAEVGPVGVVAHGDGDPVVVARGGVASVGRHVGVGVADELRHSAVDRVVEQRRAHEVERGFGLGLVDVDALAGAVAVVEGGEDRGQGESGREVVGVGGVGSNRRAAGVAGQGDVAADRGAHGAEAGDSGERSFLSEEAGGEHDQVGFDLVEGVVVHAPGAHRAGREGLGQDVAPLD